MPRFSPQPVAMLPLDHDAALRKMLTPSWQGKKRAKPFTGMNRELLDAIAKRYTEEVVPMLEAQTQRDCGCVVMTYSCRVISLCCAHASRRY